MFPELGVLLAVIGCLLMRASPRLEMSSRQQGLHDTESPLSVHDDVALVVPRALFAGLGANDDVLAHQLQRLQLPVIVPRRVVDRETPAFRHRGELLNESMGQNFPMLATNSVRHP